MKKKKNIGNDLWLVEGSSKSAIYDLLEDTIIQITKRAGSFLDKIADNNKNRKEKVEALKRSDDLFNALKSENCLDRIFKKTSNPAFNYPNYMIWVEITNRCNQKCLPCYANSTQKGNSIDTESLKNIIYQASELKFKQIQFTGGEPLLYPNIWNIVEHTRNLQGVPNIEIYTNLTLLEDKDIDLIKKYQVKIATTLMGSCPEVHDKCTQLKGSFNRFISNIRKIRDAQIDFRVGVIKLPENQNDLPFIEELMHKENLISPKESCLTDNVRPVGRGKKYSLFYSNQPNDLYLHINRDFFNMACHWNTCWGGELAITSKGEILPCVFARKQVIGSIYQKSLKEIINGPSQKYWCIKPDKINKCKDCEYRYACLDCRVLSTQHNQNLYNEPITCNYNPYI